MIIIDYLWLSMCVTNEIWVNNPFLDTWMAKLRLKTTPRLTGWRSSCSMWPTPPCRTSRSTPSPPPRWPGRPWRFRLFFLVWFFHHFLDFFHHFLLFHVFFHQACEQEAASSKKVSFTITNMLLATIMMMTRIMMTIFSKVRRTVVEESSRRVAAA